MTDGVSRARVNPLAHIERYRLASSSGCCIVGARRLDHTQQRLFRATREAAKPKLVLYITALTLASVATVVNKPIYRPHTARVLDLNGPIKFEPPTFLVSFPDDFRLSGGKICLMIRLFHFGSGVPECWRIVLF